MLAQKQPFIQRVRNSSLVERLCAENLTGLRITPKLRQGFAEQSLLAVGGKFHERRKPRVKFLQLRSEQAAFSKALGRGALCTRRNSSESGCGVYRSENAGMSSANEVRILMAGSLRFLEEGSSAPS